MEVTVVAVEDMAVEETLTEEEARTAPGLELLLLIIITCCKFPLFFITEGSEYVDPYVVLASLGFGVFLFNLLYNILNRTGVTLAFHQVN